EHAALLHHRGRDPAPRLAESVGREARRPRRPRRISPGARPSARRGARRRYPTRSADGAGRVRALPGPVVRALQHLPRRHGRERAHGRRPPPHRYRRAGRHDPRLHRRTRPLPPPPATGENDPAHGPPRGARRGVAGRFPRRLRPLPRHGSGRSLRPRPRRLSRRPRAPRPAGRGPQAGFL
ncbi:MAG: hypothetical protein AVDCRST_MAG05-5053, partial [uncultured Rubrobacteraceae bacterium]